ncbi:prolipoprotein diacylglyceryl transferase [Mycoplasma bradburyae]|uniref:Phosphatidylglycerol--prolipoprotein diacylglyceryl transferase n=1 Tax=Mycoplasma bradburyae TaxID=2963128 RepID=A0ABT5GA36_9MOLU|nr:prolipoprotein diacylglyceryl transferase [Mycoplasma bradburyae]MDC4181817.1 prolipoprotein diacylglyceryl transferase [Mycoplasma bradburyae]UTS70116.1 prolipoprotein diacylglyceryl transferase [Mycoplasma bradburyae]
MYTPSANHTVSDSFGVAFSIGSFDVRYYGILYATGILVAIIAGILRLKYKYKVDDNPYFYYVFIGIISIVFGARIWSFVIGDSKFGVTPFFAIHQGGLAIQGGVIFTLTTGIIFFFLVLRKPKYYTKKCYLVYENHNLITKTFYKQTSMWVYADAIIPTILLGQAIGRWGNFFNHEVYGLGLTAEEALSKWGFLKVLMPGVFDHMFITENGVTLFRIPIFLIESFCNVIAFVVIVYLLDFVKNLRTGGRCMLYFFSTGIVRLIIETQRDSNFKFATSIVTSALFLAGGILGFILTQWVFPRFRNKKNYFYVFNNIKIFLMSIKLYQTSKTKGLTREEIRHKLEPSKSIYNKNFSEMFFYGDDYDLIIKKD